MKSESLHQPGPSHQVWPNCELQNPLWKLPPIAPPVLGVSPIWNVASPLPAVSLKLASPSERKTITHTAPGRPYFLNSLLARRRPQPVQVESGDRDGKIVGVAPPL